MLEIYLLICTYYISFLSMEKIEPLFIYFSIDRLLDYS